MMLGFLAARVLPVSRDRRCSALAFEIMLALHIRDNLTLNIMMLIHPFEADQAMASGPADHLTAKNAACPAPHLILAKVP